MTGFGPAMNAAVWKETTLQTKALIDRWLVDQGVVAVMKTWTSKLALHVISAVFFQKTLEWSSNEKGHIPSGHHLPFDQTLFNLLENIRTLYMIPRALRGLPLRSIQAARVKFDEWTLYLHELRRDAMGRIDEISIKKNRTMIESIVHAGTIGSAKTGDRPLPEESVLGNIFFLLQAGHETTGNTLAFALNLLAVYPEYQRRIQDDLDLLLAVRPQDEWTVEHEYQVLQKGWIGAVLKEVLRVYCVVQYIPRAVVAPIHLTDSRGTSHAIPAGMLGLLDVAAAFRDPRSWSRKPMAAARRAELHHSPAIDFDPSQWLQTADVTADEGTAVGEQGDKAPPRLFPFGQGPHVCPGRLFAHIEMRSVLATVLSTYSLELIVNEETLRDCGGDEPLARQETRDRAIRMLVDDVEFNITISMRKPLPIKLVRRI